MPNIDSTKTRKITTLNRPGNDFNSELINIFMRLILLTERSGLRILKVRRTLSDDN